MPSRTPRPCTIADVVVLVAATTAALASCLSLARIRSFSWSEWVNRASSRAGYPADVFQELIPYISILLLFWAAAIVALRCFISRPRRRILWSQPGFLACVAVLFAFVGHVSKVSFLLELNYLGMTRDDEPDINADPSAGEINRLLMDSRCSPFYLFGVAVLFAWFVLWAGGRCRMEPSWIDRAGRLVGATWVILSLFRASMF